MAKWAAEVSLVDFTTLHLITRLMILDVTDRICLIYSVTTYNVLLLVILLIANKVCFNNARFSIAEGGHKQ